MSRLYNRLVLPTLIPQHFGCLVFDPLSKRYLCFDSERPSDEAARANAWLSYGGELRVREVDAELIDGHLSAPLLVHLEVNAVCNLQCSHCFAAPLPRKGPNLSLAEIDEVFAQMAAMGTMRVSLTGGEPLLRSDIFEIVDAANARGLAVALTTNGLSIDDDVARALGARTFQWINLSLDGARAETNDPVRGAGTFARITAHARVLARHAPFSLAFTLTSLNLDEVQEMVALAKTLGAHGAVFRPLYPVGAARAHPELLPDPRRLREVMSTVDVPDDDEGLAMGTCGAGETIMSIDAFGRTSPCGFLGEDWSGPSVREHTLAEIWRMPHIAKTRATPNDAFAGGCRARAQNLAGSAFLQDPWAHLR